MTRLVVSAEAEADTGHILAYLHREAGVQIATAYGLRFQRRIEALLDAPETGAPRPTLGPNTRIALVFPYLIIYDLRQFRRHDNPAAYPAWPTEHHPRHARSISRSAGTLLPRYRCKASPDSLA
jgi:plasmid stabilization system protein ParE